MGLAIGGHLEALPYLFFGFLAFAVGIPLLLGLIRLLNQTWFDPDWRWQNWMRSWETEDDKPLTVASSKSLKSNTAIWPAHDFRVRRSDKP